MATVTATTWGWFRDPYQLHEDRYFSEGSPTKLVRDAGHESFDPPPNLPLPGPPVPVSPQASQSTGGSDLRRADDAEREAPYDSRAACDRATNAVRRYGSPH
jgi:hypothetical protein